jgi:hypothetical protein
MKYHCLSNVEIKEFIKKYDHIFSKKLTKKFNYSRVVSLANFKFLIDELKLNNQKNVGMISGSENDPELKFIKYEKILYLNFPQNKIYDLDKNWKKQKKKTVMFYYL